MEKKINSIEGLRTIGWIGVFLCHFKGAFFPNTAWITDLTPLRFIYSGNAYVRLLFVISGFVLSYKYFTKEEYDNVLGDIIKRYFRLMPPVLFAEIMVYLFMQVGVLRNAEVAEIVGSSDFLGSFNRFQPNLIECLKEALFSTYFNGANGYIGPLWTMVYEYLGAILILCALYILRKQPWRWIFYTVFMFAFSGYYNYFVLGMIICDLFVNTKATDVIGKNRGCIAVSIILGYLMFSMVNLNDGDKNTRIIFSIGIIIFMLGVLSSKFMENILGSKVMVSGGRIAYSVYIVHWPIIESLSCGLVLLLYDKIISYDLMIWIVFLITFFVVVVVAKFMADFVEPIGARIARNLMS